jgi:hypothetical protein
MGWGPVPIPARGVRHSGAGDVGVLAGGPFGIRLGGGTLQAVAECNKAREAGSNPLAEPVMQAPDDLRRLGGPAPILRVL